MYIFFSPQIVYYSFFTRNLTTQAELNPAQIYNENVHTANDLVFFYFGDD